uniref:OCEL domain-containing protein n=1 Tax=Periophthalmus magnuspinnatus TaxID=409849 RepID=A0A3B3Z9W3_9GOBI
MSVGGASRFDRVREYPIYDEVLAIYSLYFSLNKIIETLNLSPPPLCLLSAPPSSLQVPVGSLYRDFPPPPAPISFSDRLSSGRSLDSLPPPPTSVLPTFYPPSDEEAEPDHDAMDIKPVHRFIPDSVKNFFRNSGRSGKSWSLRKSDRGKPCSPPHSAPPSPSLPGSYRDPYGGSGGSYVSQKDALLLGADAIDSVSSVPTNTSVQTYAERVEEYHQRYAYMKSWAGLLRILGCVELLLGAAVFACVCAYVHKDNEWFNMYGYSTPQLYGGLGGGAYGASGIPYTGSVVCLKLWRHEAARLRRQAYDQEVRCHNVGAEGQRSRGSEEQRSSGSEEVQTDQRITLVSLYRKYPSIQSDEEREKYRAVFNDQYAEYRELHAEVQSVVQRFEEMDEMMRNLQSDKMGKPVGKNAEKITKKS